MTPVLDHGYVKLIASWGSDAGIIEAARMSTGKGFLGWGPVHAKGCVHEGDPKHPIDITTFGGPPGSSFTYSTTCCVDAPGDEKLLAYLWKNRHETPFEMAGATFEVKAPIFVFREWHRHRTQSYNEMSARYTPLPDENYVPTLERCLISGGSNKQAQGDGVLTSESARAWITNVEAVLPVLEALYQEGLERGIPKELARIVLPVARYSRMRAQANLRNWLGFLRLRMAPNAQWEIRAYANVVHDELARLFPRTLALFDGESDRDRVFR